MAVTDLQTWADQLELVRLPTIKDDIASLTASQAVYASELSAKAQEFTDRLDAHDARIAAAQTDATSASVAASAVSTEVYGARLDATTYTNQKHQEALNAIQASNTDIRSYMDGDFAAYLEGKILESDQILSDEVAAAVTAAHNARDALNQEITDLNAVNNSLLDENLPAINQDLQDSLIRLVGLEYFNEEMFGGMEFPNIQELYEKLDGEVKDAASLATDAANDKDIQNLLNQRSIQEAILAAQNVTNFAQDVVAFEESGENSAWIATTGATKVDENGAIAAIETQVSAQYNDLTAMASATQSAKATTDGIQSGFAWRLNGSNVMEMFSISDGSGGVRKTAKLDFDYVQIKGLTQIDEAVIRDLVADSAFIDDLAVGTLNINGSAVTTETINGNAVSNSVTSDGSDLYFTGAVGADVVIWAYIATTTGESEYATINLNGTALELGGIENLKLDSINMRSGVAVSGTNTVSVITNNCEAQQLVVIQLKR